MCDRKFFWQNEDLSRMNMLSMNIEGKAFLRRAVVWRSPLHSQSWWFISKPITLGIKIINLCPFVFFCYVFEFMWKKKVCWKSRIWGSSHWMNHTYMLVVKPVKSSNVFRCCQHGWVIFMPCSMHIACSGLLAILDMWNPDWVGSHWCFSVSSMPSGLHFIPVLAKCPQVYISSLC